MSLAALAPERELTPLLLDAWAGPSSLAAILLLSLAACPIAILVAECLYRAHYLTMTLPTHPITLFVTSGALLLCLQSLTPRLISALPYELESALASSWKLVMATPHKIMSPGTVSPFSP